MKKGFIEVALLIVLFGMAVIGTVAVSKDPAMVFLLDNNVDTTENCAECHIYER